MGNLRKLNTHFYDGKLKERYQALEKEFLAGGDRIGMGEACQEIRELIDQVWGKIDRKGRGHTNWVVAMRMLSLLEGKKGNRDNRNGVEVHKLLPMVWWKVREWDLDGKMVFLEQLVDIKGGSCPQGRVARLLQLV